jgi:hypothetical protein
MAASKDDIKRWLASAREEGATHMIVVCDTYDYEDYPCSVMSNEDVHERVSYFRDQAMQRVMEVYSMALDDESQLNEHRAFNY